jgi:alcohol dehydrogenase
LDIQGIPRFFSTLDRAMLKERWAGAVDTVGGEILFNVVKSLRHSGSVACCGLTAGVGFQGSVLPFILRGVNLLGVDSVELPLVVKASMWDKLSLQWKLNNLESLAEELSLEQLPKAIEQILAGQMVGRVLVNLG